MEVDNVQQRRVFGRELRAAREAQGYTLSEFADRFGVDPSTIARLEAGSRGTSPRLVFALEEALGMEPGRLSGLLGFFPRSALTVTPSQRSARESILVDPALDAVECQALLVMYDSLVAGHKSSDGSGDGSSDGSGDGSSDGSSKTRVGRSRLH